MIKAGDLVFRFVGRSMPNWQKSPDREWRLSVVARKDAKMWKVGSRTIDGYHVAVYSTGRTLYAK